MLTFLPHGRIGSLPMRSRALWGMPDVISLTSALGALTLFILKHFVADFLLQPGWMALGKAKASGWFAPTAAHAAIHAVATGLIFGLLAPRYVGLAAVDLVLHFAIDRAKVLLLRAYGLGQQDRSYWWLFGIDQTLHELTNIAFALVLASAYSPR